MSLRAIRDCHQITQREAPIGPSGLASRRLQAERKHHQVMKDETQVARIAE